jgi:hypothetical protein
MCLMRSAIEYGCSIGPPRYILIQCSNRRADGTTFLNGRLSHSLASGTNPTLGYTSPRTRTHPGYVTSTR